MTMQEIQAKSIFYKNEYNWIMLYDSAIDRDDLQRILIGIVLSGSVGCFDEVNRLSPSVLSAVSSDIENL